MAGYDSFVTLLAHFNGASGATTYTADSGQIATFTGNTQLDTAVKEFGNAALLMDASGRCTFPDTADFNFTADYTVDFWFKTAVKTSDSQDRRIYNHGQATSAGTLDIYIDSSTGRIYVGIDTNAAAITGTTDISDDTWRHLAVARSGSSTKLFIGGFQEGSTFSGTENLTFAKPLYIGAYEPTGFGRFNGSIDEIRVSKGIARWTANFTPPTSQYSRAIGNQTIIL